MEEEAGKERKGKEKIGMRQQERGTDERMERRNKGNDT